MPARKASRRSQKPQEARSRKPRCTPIKGKEIVAPRAADRLRLTPSRLLDVLLSDAGHDYRAEEGCRPKIEAGWVIQLLLRAESAIHAENDRILRRKYLMGVIVTALGWIVEEGADK